MNQLFQRIRLEDFSQALYGEFTCKHFSIQKTS